MKFITSILFLLCVIFSIEARVRVITTTTDLESIAGSVGGNKIEVESLTPGKQDLHYALAQPNFILKANKADVFIFIGLDLEVGWAPAILEQSRNAKIQMGGPGYCNASVKVKVLQRPVGNVTRQMGDMHVLGNPHYWTDPVNGIKIARAIKDCLVRVDPENAGIYNKNLKEFSKKAKAKTIELLKLMKPHFNKKIVTYHQEFVYLASRFELKVPQNVELYPGVVPTPNRKREIIAFMKKEKVKVLVVSPWSNIGIARSIAEEAGIKLLILPIQTKSARGTGSYLEMIDTCARLLAKNL